MKNGAKVALVHLAEEFKRYKKKYGLNDDDALELAVIAYNAPSKARDPEFVEYYIKRKVLPTYYGNQVDQLAERGYRSSDKDHYRKPGIDHGYIANVLERRAQILAGNSSVPPAPSTLHKYGGEVTDIFASQLNMYR